MAKKNVVPKVPGDPAFWRCKRCNAHDCWSHRRTCHVCGAARAGGQAAAGARQSAWNGQRGQPPSRPPAGGGGAVRPTPPEKPPQKATNEDPELTRLQAQVAAARDFFPTQLEAAQRELDAYREGKHQHRLATKPRHFVLITLQREVTQAQKRVEAGKAAVDEILSQIELLRVDHAAAVEELAVRQAKLDTAERRRNEAESFTSKPPLVSEVAALKQQISACAPALGEAGEAILKGLSDILAQLEPPEPAAMSVDAGVPGLVPENGNGVAAHIPANAPETNRAATTATPACGTPPANVDANSGNNDSSGEGIWAEKRSELKKCLEKIRGELGANVVDGAFRSFEEVIGDEAGGNDRRHRERSRRSERSRSPHGADGIDAGAKKEG